MGLDAAKLAAFDADLAGGSYGLVDSMLVIRCGKVAYEKTYAHDYNKIYGDRAKTAWPGHEGDHHRPQSGQAEQRLE